MLSRKICTGRWGCPRQPLRPARQRPASLPSLFWRYRVDRMPRHLQASPQRRDETALSFPGPRTGINVRCPRSTSGMHHAKKAASKVVLDGLAESMPSSRCGSGHAGKAASQGSMVEAPLRSRALKGLRRRARFVSPVRPAAPDTVSSRSQIKMSERLADSIPKDRFGNHFPYSIIHRK